MTNHVLKQNLAAEMLAGIQPESIISRTLHHDEHIKAIAFGFAAGQALSEHTSARPAMILFLAGSATLTVGGDSCEVEPGTWLYMKPDLPHSITALTNLVMLLEMIQ